MLEQLLILVCISAIAFWTIFHNITQFLWFKDFLTVKRDWQTRNVTSQQKPLQHPRKLKRRYVLSLSSTPSRIHDIAKNFSSFSMTQLDAIYLNLPDKFRNHETQNDDDLEQLRKSMPKVQIVRAPEDTGPDMKILTSLSHISDDTYVIVVDDDCLQKNTLIEDQDRLWELLESHPKLSKKKQVLTALNQPIFGLDIALGQASYCFRKKDLPSEFVDRCATYRECHRQCTRHDDFTVSAAFADFDFQVLRTTTGVPLQKEAMHDEDSLHLSIPLEVKHWKCSEAIWKTRQQSPAKVIGFYEKFLKWYSESSEVLL